MQFSQSVRRGGALWEEPSGRERPVDVGLLLAVRGARCLVTERAPVMTYRAISGARALTTICTDTRLGDDVAAWKLAGSRSWGCPPDGKPRPALLWD